MEEQQPEKKDKFSAFQAISVMVVIGIVVAVLLNNCSFPSSNTSTQTTPASAPSVVKSEETHEIVPESVPKLNIGLHYFIDNINRILKKVGAKRLVADKDNPKDDSDCTEWCESNYQIGNELAFVVYHKKDRINDILCVVAADANIVSATNAFFYQWVLINAISPGHDRKEVTDTLLRMLQDVSGGQGESKAVFDGVTYKMHRVEGMGIVLEITKE